MRLHCKIGSSLGGNEKIAEGQILPAIDPHPGFRPSLPLLDYWNLTVTTARRRPRRSPEPGKGEQAKGKNPARKGRN